MWGSSSQSGKAKIKIPDILSFSGWFSRKKQQKAQQGRKILRRSLRAVLRAPPWFLTYSSLMRMTSSRTLSFWWMTPSILFSSANGGSSHSDSPTPTTISSTSDHSSTYHLFRLKHLQYSQLYSSFTKHKSSAFTFYPIFSDHLANSYPFDNGIRFVVEGE